MILQTESFEHRSHKMRQLLRSAENGDESDGGGGSIDRGAVNDFLKYSFLEPTSVKKEAYFSMRLPYRI